MSQNHNPHFNKSNFTSQHNDINLTKEETQFLETQFLKYLTREMEKDPSNWNQFYDILKEETSPGNEGGAVPTSSPSQYSSSATKPNQGDKTSKQETQSSATNNKGFKVNTEKTKEQYRSPNTNSQQQKWNRTEYASPPNSNEKINNDQNEHDNLKQPSNNSNCGSDSKLNGKKGNKHKKDDNENKPRGGKKKTAPKQTKQQKPQKQQRQQQQTTSSDNTNIHSEDKDNDLEEITSIWRRILLIVKDVAIIFACFVIMVVFFVLKFCWNVGKRILGYTLLFLLFVFSRILGFFMRINSKYQIISKVVLHTNNGLDLLHLVLGINIKGWFGRWRKKNNKMSSLFGDSRPPPELPTTSPEAIQFLLGENQENPFRILCASYTDDLEKIRTHYRKLVRLVHPDKCNLPNSEEAFKILDTAFKKLADPEKREELNTEMERHKAWEEFNQNMGEDYKQMFEDLLTTIQCSVCEKRHKKTLVENRPFFKARYCAECNQKHPAQDGDVWAEVGMLGVNWKCYACFDGEVFELSQWGRCQGLNKALPVNSHRVFCQLGTSRSSTANGKPRKSNSNHHKKHDEESGRSTRSGGGGVGGRSKKSKKRR